MSSLVTSSPNELSHENLILAGAVFAERIFLGKRRSQVKRVSTCKSKNTWYRGEKKSLTTVGSQPVHVGCDILCMLWCPEVTTKEELTHSQLNANFFPNLYWKGGHGELGSLHYHLSMYLPNFPRERDQQPAGPRKMVTS